MPDASYIADMTRLLRPVLSILLALSLVLSGQAVAQAKGASQATGQMVLCIGGETVLVFTDAEGQPTSQPHICPDCLAAELTSLLPDTSSIRSFETTGTRFVPPGYAAPTLHAHLRQPRARAPPPPV